VISTASGMAERRSTVDGVRERQMVYSYASEMRIGSWWSIRNRRQEHLLGPVLNTQPPYAAARRKKNGAALAVLLLRCPLTNACLSLSAKSPPRYAHLPIVTSIGRNSEYPISVAVLLVCKSAQLRGPGFRNFEHPRQER